MTETVLCPYCGAEMRMIPAWEKIMPEMGGNMWSARGKCPSCGSLTPETHGRTAREANEAAYAVAQRRYVPPIKPLTLEEVKKLVGVWIEDDGCCWGDDDPHPALYHARVNYHWLAFMDEDFEKDGDEYRYFVEAEYSITWRCWERKPTEEERRAAKWDAE